MAVDWAAVGAVGALVISAAGTVLVYKRGSRGDQALAMSQAADRRAKETETNLSTQGKFIDQLQEELDRYHKNLAEKQTELDVEHEQLEKARSDLRDLRHELGEARAGLSAAKVVIDGLERTVDVLQAEVAALRRLVEDQKIMIANHIATIEGLRGSNG